MLPTDALDHLNRNGKPIVEAKSARSWWTAPTTMQTRSRSSFTNCQSTGNAADLNGKQIKISFMVAKYKKGKLKKILCKSDEKFHLGPVTPACCGFQPWDNADPQSVIACLRSRSRRKLPLPWIYRYVGPDFPRKLSQISTKTSSPAAIQDYINKYQAARFPSHQYQLGRLGFIGWEGRS
jgi:hypothetical protein